MLHAHRLYWQTPHSKPWLNPPPPPFLPQQHTATLLGCSWIIQAGSTDHRTELCGGKTAEQKRGVSWRSHGWAGWDEKTMVTNVSIDQRARGTHFQWKSRIQAPVHSTHIAFNAKNQERWGVLFFYGFCWWKEEGEEEENRRETILIFLQQVFGKKQQKKRRVNPFNRNYLVSPNTTTGWAFTWTLMKMLFVLIQHHTYTHTHTHTHPCHVFLFFPRRSHPADTFQQPGSIWHLQTRRTCCSRCSWATATQTVIVSTPVQSVVGGGGGCACTDRVLRIAIQMSLGCDDQEDTLT